MVKPNQNVLTFDNVIEFFTWCKESGALHAKAPGGYEVLWPPPVVQMEAHTLDEPLSNEPNLKNYMEMPLPLHVR